MGCTKGEKKVETLGQVWEIFKEHGLEGKYCPHCDQFSQARVLLKQDQLISELYKALKAIREEGTRCLDMAQQDSPVREIYDIDKVDRLAREAIAKVEV